MEFSFGGMETGQNISQIHDYLLSLLSLLVFRFWMIGCMPEDYLAYFVTFEVDFFTIKDPRETPEFCGCLLSSMQIGNTVATKEQIKECYVKGLTGGPSSRTAITSRRTGINRKKERKFKKHHEKRLKKKDKRVLGRIRKLERLNRKHKTRKSMKNLKKFVHKLQSNKNPHWTGRSKRDVSEEEMYEEEFDEDYFSEEEFDQSMFNEEDLSGDEMEMDFENEFEFEEGGDVSDDYDEDYDEDYYDYDDDSLSSDW